MVCNLKQVKDQNAKKEKRGNRGHEWHTALVAWTKRTLVQCTLIKWNTNNNYSFSYSEP